MTTVYDFSPDQPLLSVIVPVHNEAATLAELLRRLLSVPLSKEVLVIDDGSTDGSNAIARSQQCGGQIRVLCHPTNRGKGSAIRTGINAALGRIVVVQDADLEYDPADLPKLVEPITADRADVVFGTRFGSGSCSQCDSHRRWANHVLTWLSNRTTGLPLTDMETCYKAMRREVVVGMELREERFGIEPELTAKVARRGCRIVEVPIRYKGRSYAAGKQIGWLDGLCAVWCILRYSRWD